MEDAKRPDGQTALQRIRKLEQDFKTLDEQLEQVPDILGNDAFLEPDFKILLEEEGFDRPRFHGRSKWAVNWVLEKLKSNEGAASVKAWTLLSNLVVVLPVPALAHALANQKFLLILGKTLETNFPSQPLAIATKEDALLNDTSVVPNGDDPGSSYAKKRKRAAYDISSTIKKRPRSDDGSDSSFAEDHAYEADHRLDLFVAIAACMQRVVDAAEQRDCQVSNPSIRHLQSVLRADPSHATRLLGYWFRAVKLATENVSRTLNLQLQYDGPVSWFSAILYIWNCSSPRSRDLPNQPVRNFSADCLIPAIRLLQKSTTVQERQLRGGISSPTSREAERLLARHVFSPARAYENLRRASDTSDNTSDTNSDLESLLQPLRNHLQSEDVNRVESEDERELASAIPALFEISLRHMPRSTPKQRMAESSWAEKVFVTLADCLGFTSDATLIAPLNRRLPYLHEMLQIALTHDVRLTPELLTRLLDFSGLNEVKNVFSIDQWNIICSIIGLDSDIFLQGLLSDNLFKSITADGWMESRPHHESNGQTKYSIIRDNAAVPIMHAYAHARDLSTFLEKWRLSILSNDDCIWYQKSASDPDSPYLSSVWGDQALVETLGDIMETSMTTHQIFTLVKTLPGELEAPVARLVVISAILSAMKTDTMLTEIFGIAERLFLGSLSAVLRNAAEITDLRFCVWRSLAPAYKVWSHSLNGSQVSEHIASKLSEFQDVVVGAVELALSSTRLEEVLVGIEALSCAATISHDLRARHFTRFSDFTIVERTLRKILELMEERQGSIVGAVLEKFLAIYPSLLRQQVLHLQRDDFDAVWNIAKDEEAEDTRGFLSVWEAMVLTVLDQADRTLQTDAIGSAIAAFKTCKAELTSRIGTLVLQIPTHSMSQDQTISMFKHLKQGFSTVVAEDHVIWLNLILRILEGIRDRSAVSIELSTLWSWANDLDTNISDHNVNRAKIFRRIVIDELRIEEWLQDVAKKVSDVKTYQASPFMLIVVDVAFQTIRKHIEKKSENFAMTNWKTLQQKHARTLLSDARAIYDRGESEQARSMPFELDTIFVAFFHIDVDILEKDGRSLKQLQERRPTKETSLGDEHNDFLRLKLKSAEVQFDAITSQPNGHQPHSPSILECLQIGQVVCELGVQESLEDPMVASPQPLPDDETQISLEDEQKMLQCFREGFSALDSTRKIEIIAKLLSDKEAMKPGLAELRLLKSAIGTLDDTLSGGLDVLSKISLEMGQARDFEQFKTTTDIILVVLGSKAKLVSQFGIEVLLSEIHRTCSQHGSDLPTYYAGSILNQLCKILLKVLVSYRRYVQGRYHLLVPVVQSVLRYFFSSQLNHPNELIVGPPWKVLGSKKLKRKHAWQYTRVLTTLCDPTPASLKYTKKNKATSDLTDATRKEREIIGQFAPAIILEFCQCQLRGGKLEPSIRETLIPGIYALFGVMGMAGDVRETTNSGLNTSTRAVFRSLYEDYKKFGKWQES